MKKAVLLACAAAGAFTAAAFEARMTGDGRIASAEAGFTMGVRINAEGWRGSHEGRALPRQRFPDPEKGLASWRAGKGEETCAHGTVAFRPLPNGAAAVHAVAVSDVDQRPESVVWSVELSAAAFAGGTWATESKKGTLPATFDGRRTALFNGRCTRLALVQPGGRTLAFSFAEPVPVLVQDSRRWGNNLTVRLFNAKVPFPKGAERVFDFTFSSSDGVSVAYAQPTVVRAGAEWIPVDYRKDVVAGSALDFSNQGLQDAPAGKYGWLKNVGGHFEFEKLPGRPQRFYGVNLCFGANVPEHELADALVTRLVRLGYNTVRVHHYERDLLAPGAKGGRAFDASALDRFDYLMAKAIAAGLYITTDLFVSRSVRWADIGHPERPGTVEEKSVYKCLVAVSDAAFADWCAFSKMFLEHVNPYTGRRYLDEPALPLISLVNEGQLTMGWHRGGRDEPEVQAAYATWLAEKRAVDPAFCPNAPTEASKLSYYGANGNVLALFMTDVERRSAARMAAFLRKLGSKAQFTNANNGPHPMGMQNVRADLYDYVDVHFYVDHPQFLEKRWSLPSRIRNLNPVLDPNLALLEPAFVRLADKPLCVTEWNFSGPGMYRGVGGIMTGAFSALQDWDGLWRFAYSHSVRNLAEGPCTPGYFDVGTDPLGQASDRASVCLFLRRDLSPLAAGTALRVVDAAIAGSTNANRVVAVRPKWSDAAWSRRVATAGARTQVPSGMDELPGTEALVSAKSAPFVCGTSPEFALDRARGAFMINTPRTAGGFTPRGRLDCGAVSFAVDGTPATVWASSVDAEPTELRRARRILVTHLTDVQADGNVYQDEEKTVLLKWGAARPIARAGRAEVRIRHDRAAELDVWSLETTGARRARVPSKVEDGAIVFTAEIAAPSACLNYEVVNR